jgi:hypothetical protein
MGASTSTAMGLDLAYTTSVDSGAGASWTTITPTSTTSGASVTTYQRLNSVYSIPSTATSLRVRLYSVNNIANTVVVYFGNVQLELGSTATTFSRAGGTIQGELAACQRYYYRQSAVESFSDFGLGFAVSTTSARIEISMPVTMRVAATSLEYSTLILWDGSGTNTTVTSAALGEVGLQRLRLTIGVASGLTQYRPYSLLANNSTSAYVGFSAEL